MSVLEREALDMVMRPRLEIRLTPDVRGHISYGQIFNGAPVTLGHCQAQRRTNGDVRSSAAEALKDGAMFAVGYHKQIVQKRKPCLGGTFTPTAAQRSQFNK